MIASMSTSARARLNHGLRDAQNVCALTKVGTVLKGVRKMFKIKINLDYFTRLLEFNLLNEKIPNPPTPLKRYAIHIPQSFYCAITLGNVIP